MSFIPGLWIFFETYCPVLKANIGRPHRKPISSASSEPRRLPGRGLPGSARRHRIPEEDGPGEFHRHNLGEKVANLSLLAADELLVSVMALVVSSADFDIYQLLRAGLERGA